MTEQKMTEQDFYKWLGKRLRELREKAGMKQKELAEKTGIDATIISRAENTGKKMSAYQIDNLLKAMGFTQANLAEDSTDDVKKNLCLPSMATA